MTLLKVLSVPDPKLRIKAKPVDLNDPSIGKILDDMVETMYHEEGLGLAAPQVGISLRLVVIDLGVDQMAEEDSEEDEVAGEAADKTQASEPNRQKLSHQKTSRQKLSFAKSGIQKASLIKMINPEITWRSAEMSICNEGCLSVPELRAEVSRPKDIKMHYHDAHGVRHHIETNGLLATCIQHELDHLDGKLYIDYLSPLKRQIYINKVKKNMK